MVRKSAGFSIPYVLLMVLVVSGLLLLVVSLAAPDLHPTFAAMRDYLSSRESMLGRGLSALEAGDHDEAIRWLEEAVREDPGVQAWSWLGHVRNAGGIFVGETASEALGDYVVGPSHIMPTKFLPMSCRSPFTVPKRTLPIIWTPASASSGLRMSMDSCMALAERSTSGTNILPALNSTPT